MQVIFPQSFDYLHAIQLRHHDIRDKEIDITGIGNIEALFHRCCGDHLQFRFFQDIPAGVQNHPVIIQDKHLLYLFCFHHIILLK